MMQSNVNLLYSPLEHLHSASVLAYIPASLTIETKENNGISHLLEHMHFRGFPGVSQQQLYAKMEMLGASFHGLTDSKGIMFYFTAVPKNLSAATSLFIDFLSNDMWSLKDFQAEKRVVIRQRIESEYFREKQLEKFIFGSHPYTYPIAGYRSVVERIKLQDVVNFQHKIFSLDNMYFYLAGKIEDDFMEDFRHEIEMKFPKRSELLLRNVPPQWSDEHRKKIRPKWANGEVTVGIRVPQKSYNVFQAEMLFVLLCMGPGALLMRELREEKALCTYLNSDINAIGDDFLIEFSFETEVDRIPEAIEITANALWRCKHNLERESFMEVVPYYTDNRVFVLDFPEKLNFQLLNYFKDTGSFQCSFDTLQKGFGNVTYEGIAKMAREVLNPDHLYLMAETRSERSIKYFFERLAQ